MKRKMAFTLAEVLITLGIIGIVAAMTIPTLLQKTNERETVSKLKKFYSEISQSYNLLKVEYGTPDNWYGDNVYSMGDIQASIIMGDMLLKNMKVLKACHNNSGCFPNVTYKKIDGSSAQNWDTISYISSYILADGVSVFFYSYGSTPQNVGNENDVNDSQYGAMAVDINGAKGPNMFGKDMFSFRLNKRGIMPIGLQGDNYSFPDSCNIESCSGNCEGCSSWVIYNDNMDYLHCSDLSWSGKTKCN